MAARFDEFTKALAQQHTRRGMLRVAAGAAIGAALARLGRPETAEQATLEDQANPCSPSVVQRCKVLQKQRADALDVISRTKRALQDLQNEA
jgi:hypothetical protein